jgi:hypothetical protein
MINLEKTKEILINQGYIENEHQLLSKQISTYNSKDIQLIIDWLINPEFENEERNTIDLLIIGYNNELIHEFIVSKNIISDPIKLEKYLISIEAESKFEINQWTNEKLLGY